jgi:hypothetical protein
MFHKLAAFDLHKHLHGEPDLDRQFRPIRQGAAFVCQGEPGD